MFEAWRDELKVTQQFLTAEVVELAERRYEYDQSFVHPALRSALLTIAAQRNAPHIIDPRRLGIWLKKNENTIVGGHKLTVDRGDLQRPHWRLTSLGR